MLKQQKNHHFYLLTGTIKQFRMTVLCLWQMNGIIKNLTVPTFVKQFHVCDVENIRTLRFHLPEMEKVFGFLSLCTRQKNASN